jgi:hypothetical protein
MPVIAALAALLVVMVAAAALMPLSLVLRYRAGTARRRARGWVAALNTTAIAASATLFLGGAALSSLWVPRAFRYTLGGFAAGVALGLLGLWWSRWEPGADSLHYTPNRWLVLAVMLVVATRAAYGVWRTWHAWHTTSDRASWLAAAGIGGSLAAGALVLGYYLAYWSGVWLRVRRHRRARGGPVRTDSRSSG